MSESDTMSNKRDLRCAAVQLMLSTDPSYENRPLPALSKCKSGLPWITGTCPGWLKQSFRLQLWSLVWFQVRATSCHLTASKSAWKSTPKCTWMCWRVWWSPVAIRWPVAEPGCGSRTLRRSTSPKRARLGFRRSATTLYPSLTGPLLPDLNSLDYFVWSYVENITYMTSHNTKASLIAAIRRVFAELPPALVEKAYSQYRIRIEVAIEAEGGYIELMSALLHNQVTWIDFFNKSFKIKLLCCFL